MILSGYSSEKPYRDASEVWILFCETYLILDMQAMFRLQYLIAKNFDENTQKNEIWKSYLGNKKEQKCF